MKAMPDVNIKDPIKRELEHATVFALVFLGLMYGVFYLPGPVMSLIESRFNEISIDMKSSSIAWGTMAVTAGFSAVGAYVIGRVLIFQDILANSQFSAAKFFCKQYPSEAIKAKYECTTSEANHLWFSFYNPWCRDSRMPQHEICKHTFKRSYACRFVYHIRWALVVFEILSPVTWAISVELGAEKIPVEMVYARLLWIVVAGLIILMLFGLNRVNAGSTGSGCWRRWHEINGIHRQWLENAVFKTAHSYDEAANLLKDPKWCKVWGFK